MSKVGRNDPCPCGSGKKYKKCCLVDTFETVGREESIQKRLVESILRLIRKNYKDILGDAHSVFWNDFDPEEHLDSEGLDQADINFWEWVVFDYTVDDEGDKTFVELYMAQNKKLSLDEHKILTMMKNSILSLYEVQEVIPEKGII